MRLLKQLMCQNTKRESILQLFQCCISQWINAVQAPYLFQNVAKYLVYYTCKLIAIIKTINVPKHKKRIRFSKCKTWNNWKMIDFTHFCWLIWSVDSDLVHPLLLDEFDDLFPVLPIIWNEELFNFELEEPGTQSIDPIWPVQTLRSKPLPSTNSRALEKHVLLMRLDCNFDVYCLTADDRIHAVRWQCNIRQCIVRRLVFNDLINFNSLKFHSI